MMNRNSWCNERNGQIQNLVFWEFHKNEWNLIPELQITKEETGFERKGEVSELQNTSEINEPCIGRNLKNVSMGVMEEEEEEEEHSQGILYCNLT